MSIFSRSRETGDGMRIPVECPEIGFGHQRFPFSALRKSTAAGSYSSFLWAENGKTLALGGVGQIAVEGDKFQRARIFLGCDPCRPELQRVGRSQCMRFD